ncbi:VWA domain-containing protein [Thalassoglobus neptunius]|uniref:VWA domain-containing protein n=1 Tax=Thalassoglobus neptunius TaxID=1938619 RepID=UPI001E2AC64F|nr:VWA domain-containing protein [Thalassoglobus neptunius]
MWTVYLAGFAVIVGAAWVTAVATRSLPKRLRILSFASRFLVGVMLALLLLQVRLKVLTFGKATIAVVIDTSLSMQNRDGAANLSSPDASRLNVFEGDVSRLELVKKIFAAPSQNISERLTDQYNIDLFSFDSSIHGPQRISESSEFDDNVNALTPTGRTTDILGALNAIRESYQGRPPAAVLLVTDGNQVPKLITETGRSNSEQRSITRSVIRDSLNGFSSPFIVLGTGNSEQTVDLRIASVDAEPIGFVGDVIDIRVQVESNQQTSSPATIELIHDGTDEVADSTEFRFDTGQTMTTVDLTIPDLKVGRNTFRIAIVPQPGEVEVGNNTRTVSVYGRETSINVLLIDSLPRWEFRRLKSTLERDRNITLRTLLLSSDAQYVTEDRTAVLTSPRTLDELKEYDSVVIGDLVGDDLPSEFWMALPEYVEKTGAGLIFIPGRRLLSSDWETLPYSKLLPMTPAGVAVEEPRIPVIPTLTAEGRAQRMLPRSIQESASEQLPAVYPHSMNLQIHPAAIVLLQGNSETAESQGLPLSVSMRLGRGQILQQAFDDSWRWKFLIQGELYRQFWSQLVRYSAKMRMAEQLPSVELLINPEQASTNQPIDILVLDRGGEFDENRLPQLQLTQDKMLVAELSLQPTSDMDQLYAHQFSSLAPGTYEATILADQEETSALKRPFRVSPYDAEASSQAMDRSFLEELAAVSGGSFQTPDELEELIQRLPEGPDRSTAQTTILPLWNRWEILCLAILGLTVDWVIRRRFGLN